MIQISGLYRERYETVGLGKQSLTYGMIYELLRNVGAMFDRNVVIYPDMRINVLRQGGGTILNDRIFYSEKIDWSDPLIGLGDAPCRDFVVVKNSL